MCHTFRLVVAAGRFILPAALISLFPAAGGQAGAVARNHLPVPAGAISHVFVVDLENESASATFGPGSPATYLLRVLEPLGVLIQNYDAVGHVSLDNYIAQVSGQAPNFLTSSDCIASGTGQYVDVQGAALDPNQKSYPGQIDGQGCVMPREVQTIGNQLDAQYPKTLASDWREYAEDMGNDPSRDHGVADPLGGTDCAHPVQVNGQATDPTETAEGPDATGGQVRSPTTDQYVDRHNPFIYFHSVVDNAALCDRDVVPLGTATPGATGLTYHGHLAQDLARVATTPRFAFITPNVCDDGHDASCAGLNSAGTTTGGLVAANAWLQAWMPLVLHSPAYRSGKMLVVITVDESENTDTTAGDHEQAGPNDPNPGLSPLFLGSSQEPAPETDPGGGQVGALLLNPLWVRAGTVDTTGSYNHYSALRTYEDLLGITRGGADGHGHLGFAATAHDFSSDVFQSTPSRHPVAIPG